MRVLAATHRSQGARPTDFAHCIEGELVWIPEACDYDGDQHRDCDCGCARVFAGMASGSGTTTAVIVELDITRDQLTELVRAGLEQRGWPGDWAEGDVHELGLLTDAWHVGDIIERNVMAVGRRFDPVTGELLAPLKAGR